MSYEHSTTDTDNYEAPLPEEQTILDIVEERFWKPYEELVRRQEQHVEFGLDTTGIDKEIKEFDELYLSLGGAELTSAENDVNNANNASQAAAAEDRFYKAQEKFFANLQKHDGIDEAPINPVEVAERVEPVIVESPAPIEQPKEAEAESESKATETIASSIKPGDTVWNRPKRKDGEPSQKWSNEWKVIKILPPTEKIPREVVMLELNGVKDYVSMETLVQRQERNQPKPTEKQKADHPAPTPEEPTKEPVIAPKAPSPKKQTRGGIHQRKDGAFVVESKAEHQAEFLDALQVKLDEMVKHGRLTEEQAAARMIDGKNVSGGLTGHAVKDAFRFANADPTIKEHDRRTAHENQLAKADRPVFGDDKTNKWFNDIMENTSISQAQKEYLLSFGPEGPQRDKIDSNEIKRQLEAEGFDYSNIAPAAPLAEDLQAELGDAREALGLAPSESLSRRQSNELNNAREALGLPAEKKVRMGRVLLRSAGNLPAKSYKSTRDAVKNRGGWFNSSEQDTSTSEKTDDEKNRAKRAKKTGRKTWSIFAREEKPKDSKKVKKQAMKDIKKLGRKSRW